MSYEFGLRTTLFCDKWKSNDTQSASHRSGVKDPSKVTLDEVQPSASQTLCFWAELQLSLCKHLHFLAGQTESTRSVCNFEPSSTDSSALFAFSFSSFKGSWEMCSWPLKEEFHLVLAPCFPSVHFRYAQLSKHEERLEIRRQHLSYTHKPLSFGSFFCICSGLSLSAAADAVLTLWLSLRAPTEELKRINTPEFK